MIEHHRQHPVGDVLVMLAFSGGGTRAAALSYGVLKALRDTRFDIVRRIISRESRSEIAVRYYDRHLFHGATFADIKKEGPFILINASDLEAGEQFIFAQGSFDILCSNLDTFKIARAVAASSAVPLVFDPVVLENHAGCDASKPSWLLEAEMAYQDASRLQSTIQAVGSYFDKERRRYIHLVDGGVTDNLGVRPLYTLVGALGGAKKASQLITPELPSHVLLVVVDASTGDVSVLGRSRHAPSLLTTIGSVSNAQLRRYNTETLALIRRSMRDWETQMSGPERPISAHLVQVSLSDIENGRGHHQAGAAASRQPLHEWMR